MYERHKGQENQLTGLICVETDDLLGGGCGPKFHEAVEALRKRYKYGKWEILMDAQIEYGGRTIKQFRDFGFQISMSRYLREKSTEI